MESMFTLTGQVINVFVTPTGVNKSSGEEYGGQDKVQVLGDIPLPNGETKKDIVTLTTHNASDFKSLTGSTVSLPVSFYAPSKGQVIFFIPKGYKPSEAA
jgi:hypothetical protein